MKLTIKKVLTLALMTTFSGHLFASENNQTPSLAGPYLGQTPPSTHPEVFAPNIISTKGWEYGVVFAPNLSEMYYVREVNAESDPVQQFVVFEQQEQGWSERVISDRVGTPTLSPNNQIMFFGRSYKTRTEDGWSEMKRLGEDFEEFRIMRVTASLNGNIAFDEATREADSQLRYAALEKGKYLAPTPFPKQINTGMWNAHPFLAPDESYVIWDGQRGSETRNADLYISFKEPDGTWGEAIKFGDDINTPRSEFAAQVSPDGKYLFFNRNVGEDNVDTFWVDASVIEALKPKHIKEYAAKQAPTGNAAQASGRFRDVPVLETPFYDAAPESSDNSLAATKLALTKDKKAKLVKLVEELGEGKHGNYDSLLIAKNNQLVFESYFKRGRLNLTHPQASATKGYTALILGRAVQLGYLSMADLDKPLISFLKDIDATKLVEGADKITLHKALTMHGGLNVDREKWQALEKATPEVLQGQGLVQMLLTQSAPITAESQTYKYGNYNPMLVMSVLDAVVPNGAQQFIKTEILDKLNIANYDWATHISGLPQAGWMVSLTSRDMLKFGNIVANEGKWQGQQFVPAEYVEKLTSSLVDPIEDWIPEEYRYGYFWYTAPLKVDNKTYQTAFAWGGGGQRVIVVKDLDLVIAITGHDGDDKIMQQIQEVVLPAFIE